MRWRRCSPCVEFGNCARAVGVSNFDQGDMLRAYSTLARHKVPLASNQVHYSLLRREVEKNGLLARCKELGIRLIAYSPLEMGLLTGKYGPGKPRPETAACATPTSLAGLGRCSSVITDIGQEHGGEDKCAGGAQLGHRQRAPCPFRAPRTPHRRRRTLGALGWELTRRGSGFAGCRQRQDRLTSSTTVCSTTAPARTRGGRQGLASAARSACLLDASLACRANWKYCVSRR